MIVSCNRDVINRAGVLLIPATKGGTVSQKVPKHEDHETRLMQALNCIECGSRMELVALRQGPMQRKRGEDPETIAICRRCEIGYNAKEWAKRHEQEAP